MRICKMSARFVQSQRVHQTERKKKMFHVKRTFVSRETAGIDDKIPGSDLGCRVFFAGLSQRRWRSK